MQMLEAMARVQRRWVLTLVVGIALEALAMTLIGTDDSISGIRGIGGETAVSLAVVGAVFGGPWVGVAMAAVGWGLFFPLVAHSHPSSVVALPEWLFAAYLTGWLSTALVRADRARTLAERERESAHALRAPVATIHGLVDVLRARFEHSDDERRILRSIADETDRLLRSEVFGGSDRAA